MLKEGNSPSESFANILKMARGCSACVGMDVAAPNFRLNWINSVVISAIILYFIFTITTIIDIYEENPAFVLEASCTVGSVLQGAGKLVTGFVYSKTFLKLRYELEELHKEYEQKGGEYVKALNRSCKRVRTIIKIFGCNYFFSIMGIIAVPIGMAIFQNKRYLMMHFLLPGLDVKTDFGFYVTTFSHSCCMYFGGFGLYAGDMLVVIFLLQSLLFADIFALKVKELNTMLENSEDIRMQRILFKDIIDWHKKYTVFNITCNEIFYYTITVQITTACISILCTLFVLLTGDWPSGYAYILMPVISLYSYCMLGTEIEICNDRFTDEIYDIKWFLLPQKDQELVCFVLVKSQTPATIDIAGIMPLSVATALQITKTIYSSFMMMLQVLVD